MKRNFFQTLVMFAALVALSACGGGGSTGSGSNGNGGNGSGNGGGSGGDVLSISFKSAPPKTLEINLTTSLTATVSNDSKNKGVDWSCTPAASCGTFSPAHTASGAATTYVAPNASGAVTVKATATADSTKSTSASLAVDAVASASSLNGQYAFLLSGSDAAGNPYSMAGSVTLDGAGNVTAGVEDYNAPSESVLAADNVITGGTYSLAANGTGTMTFTGTATTVGVAGVQTLGLAVVNNNHVLISEFDAADTSSGSMDLQTASAFTTASFAGGYSFSDMGTVSGTPYVLGGVMSSDGAGNIPSSTVDVDVSGSTTQAAPGGTYTAPDTNGRGTLLYGGLNFAYYVINSEVIRIVDVDSTVSGAGTLYSQGSGTGSFSTASFSGNFAMGGSGQSPSGQMAAAGEFTADGAGNISAGEADVNQALVVTNGSVAGTYTMASSGYGSASLTQFGGDSNVTTFGVYLVDPNLNMLDPNNTSNGKGGAVILDLDTNAFGAYLSVPRASSFGFQGNYAVGISEDNASGELDVIGQLAAKASGSASGTANINALFTASGQQTGVALSGTFVAGSSNADRFTTSLTAAGNPNTVSLAAYETDGGQLMVVETDTNQLASGYIEHQQ